MGSGGVPRKSRRTQRAARRGALQRRRRVRHDRRQRPWCWCGPGKTVAWERGIDGPPFWATVMSAGGGAKKNRMGKIRWDFFIRIR